MKPFRILVAAGLSAVLLPVIALDAADRGAPLRPSGAAASALTPAERDAVVSWVLAQAPVRTAIAGHRTRVLRVWSEPVKSDGGSSRRAVVVLRDYETGTAREIAADVPTGRIEMRELAGVQPSAEEMEEGMSIIRRDPVFASLVADPALELLGGFHNRSSHRDDPCARDVCLEFAFLRPNYRGPARYVVVNLSRRVVAHHDFRARPGEPRPRMTERGAQ